MSEEIQFNPGIYDASISQRHLEYLIRKAEEERAQRDARAKTVGKAHAYLIEMIERVPDRDKRMRMLEICNWKFIYNPINEFAPQIREGGRYGMPGGATRHGHCVEVADNRYHGAGQLMPKGMRA